MSFAVRLAVDTVPIESGATVPCALEVLNQGPERERFELSVEGVDPEWVVVPVPEFVAEPGESLDEKVFFKPARSSESLAGNYPFVIRVRSLESGEVKTAQGVVQIRPYHYISMELMPRRATVSPVRKRVSFHATVMNLGNTEHTLQFFGSDPDDGCFFEFEQEQMTVGPGQQKTIDIQVGANGRRFFSSTRLYNFVVSARSLSTPSILSSAQAQLESRASVTPMTLAVLLFFTLLGWIWLGAIPKTPGVSVVVSKDEAMVGESVDIAWHATYSDSVYIKFDGQQRVAPDLVGHLRYAFTKAGPHTIEAVPMRNDRPGIPDTKSINIVQPPAAPEPVIQSLEVTPKSVNLGDIYTLKYTLLNTASARIGETMEPLDVNVNERQFTATRAGDQVYTVVAVGADPKQPAVKKTFKIRVKNESTANILSFEADTDHLDAPGKVTLKWQVTNAAAVTLTLNGKETAVDATQAGLQVDISETTWITLKAVDDKNRPTKKPLKIVVKPPEPLPTPEGPSTTDGTAPQQIKDEPPTHA